MEKGERREGFVKHEYGKDMAQSAIGLKQEEMNLIRKVNNRTNELLDCLRSAESMSEKINNKLLPQMEKSAPKEGKAEQSPNGWFEEHLADLGCLLRKAVNIADNLEILNRETKTEQK